MISANTRIHRLVAPSLSLALALLVPPARAQMPPTKVVVGEAQVVDAAATITLVGTVEPVRRSNVASELAGLIVDMPARQGDFIAEGDVICKLDEDTLSLRLAEAKASLDALTARHEELVAGPRPQELTRLKALLDEATAEYERWQFEMDRIEALYQDRDSNAKEYYDTRAEFLTAERRKIAAEASYDMAVEGSRKEVIARAAYEVAEQQAVVDRVRSDLAKATVRAPFSGYVVQRIGEIGEWMPAGGQVVEMVDLATVLVRVDVPEAALPFVKEGNSTRVKIDAVDKAFEGTVKHVLRQADVQARTFPVEIEIDNKEGQLAAGMFARATVTAGAKKRIVAVPKDAVVQREGVDKIATIMPGRQGGTVAMLIDVTVGGEVDQWIAITSGNVKPGMPVIIRGNESIQPFPTPVIVVDAKGTPVEHPLGPPSNEPAQHPGGA